MAKSVINITSYNSTGFGLAAQNYIETLLLFSDVLCVQEHFLLDSRDRKHSNTNKLKTMFGDKHDMMIIRAHKDTNSVTPGHGKGGLVIMWKKFLTKYVTQVNSSTFRIQAIKFNVPGNTFLLLNSYFPCDPRNENIDNTELMELLGELRSVILSAQCNQVILTGDLNCHFARQNSFTNTISDCLESLNLIPIWENTDNDPDHLICPVDYTYLNLANNVISASTLDHFCMSEKFY